MYIPRNPRIPPTIARKIFSGRLLVIPNCLSVICIITVIRILEEPMVAVIEAPILLRPIEYDRDPINGSNEKRTKIIMVFINNCGSGNRYPSVTRNICNDSYENPIIKPTRINPEISMVVPATSIDECRETSLVRKRTPIPNPNADSIASISPKVISVDGRGDVMAVCRPFKILLPISLNMEIKNPINARTIPIT